MNDALIIEGSVSDEVVRRAPCPVLVVRSHESDEAREQATFLRGDR
jgi:nucleotide-binding universal stress UspA family protein